MAAEWAPERRNVPSAATASSTTDTRAAKEAIQQPTGQKTAQETRAAHGGERQRAASRRDAAIGEQRRDVRDRAVLRDRADRRAPRPGSRNARRDGPSRRDAGRARVCRGLWHGPGAFANEDGHRGDANHQDRQVQGSTLADAPARAAVPTSARSVEAATPSRRSRCPTSAPQTRVHGGPRTRWRWRANTQYVPCRCRRCRAR